MQVFQKKNFQAIGSGRDDFKENCNWIARL